MADESWWVDLEDLDEDQQKVFALDPDDNFLVLGPAGSGKTNLLLLRAHYLTANGRPNVVVLAFTGLLRDFVVRGSNHYNFNSQKVMTFHSWMTDILRQHDVHVDKALPFDQKRAELAAKLKELFDSNQKLEKSYDCILVDEAQDCTQEEIELFFRAGKTVFFVGDSRQQVYQTTRVIEPLKKRVKNHTLTAHYRNGRKICAVADEIGALMGEDRMVGSSNYDERGNPSKAEFLRCKDEDEQFAELCSRLTTQLNAFPEELLGVAVPRRAQANALQDRFRSSSLADFVCNEDEPFDPFRPDARIVVTTIQKAKGLEFRTMHLPFAEAVADHGPREKKVSYTGVTRAKTSLSVYSITDLPPHLESAREVTLDPRPPVDPISLFPGRRKA